MKLCSSALVLGSAVVLLLAATALPASQPSGLLPADAGQVSAFAFGAGGALYVGTIPGYNQGRVYKATAGGRWRLISGGGWTWLGALAADPRRPGTLYAGTRTRSTRPRTAGEPGDRRTRACHRLRAITRARAGGNGSGSTREAATPCTTLISPPPFAEASTEGAAGAWWRRRRTRRTHRSGAGRLDQSAHALRLVHQGLAPATTQVHVQPQPPSLSGRRSFLATNPTARSSRTTRAWSPPALDRPPPPDHALCGSERSDLHERRRRRALEEHRPWPAAGPERDEPRDRVRNALRRSRDRTGSGKPPTTGARGGRAGRGRDRPQASASACSPSTQSDRRPSLRPRTTRRRTRSVRIARTSGVGSSSVESRISLGSDTAVACAKLGSDFTGQGSATIVPDTGSPSVTGRRAAPAGG